MTHAPLPRPPERPLSRFGRRRPLPARREPRLTLPRAALLPARWGRPGRARSLGPWALASLLLHALLLLPLVLDLHPRGRPSEALPPPSFDIVFEGGGAERQEADAPEGLEVPPAPPAAPPAPAQPPIVATPPPPTPAPPIPEPPAPQPPSPTPLLAQAPEAEAPLPPPPLPPRPEAPSIAEASPEPPTAEQMLAPQTELRLPERFELPLPPPPTPPTPAAPPPPTPTAPPPRQQAQRPPPSAPPQPARPVQPRPDLPGARAPNAGQIGPQPAAPQPPSGRPQGRGLDTRVDPRFLEGPASADPSVRVTGAQVGADWRAAFRRWLDQNIRYPERAIQLGEDGTVRVRVVAAPDGTVRSVQLIGPSTSPSLNFGTTFPFQGARLPAFPPPADPNGVTIDLTVNYILTRR